MSSIHRPVTRFRSELASNMRCRIAVYGLGQPLRTLALSGVPYGRGAHPYLTLGTATIDRLFLTLPARTVLQSDQRGLPTNLKAVEGTGYDFRQSRRIGSTVLDHAFTDLQRNENGNACVTLRDPDSGIQVSLWVDHSYPYLMLFSGDPFPDVSRRSLAIEPMTCPPNAFRTGVSLIELESGSSCTGTWGIAGERDVSFD